MNAVVKKITPERLEQLEGALLEMPQVECHVRHIFGPGIYMREVTIPAGTFAVGHFQKTNHMNVMVSGRVTVMNDDGTTTELRAPLTFVAPPGRKVGYVHEDMVWLNVYPTDETDVEKLEATYLEKSATFHSHQKAIADNRDFPKMLEDLSVDAETVRAQSEDEADLIPLPWGAYKFKVAASAIDGRGLIATADIAAGEFICPAKIGDKRTPAGRYTNHAKEPNAIMQKMDDGNIYLIALRDIKGCVGGQDGEEITVDYRDSVKAIK